MKKIIALVMALCLCAAALSVFAFAAEPTNPEIEIEYTAIPPTLDGTVNLGEYGLKVHSVDYNDPNFGSAYDKDQSIKADFYCTWDKDSLYLAWVVESNYAKHSAPIKEPAMWQYCCVQFIMTTGRPDSTKKTYQTADWSGNYLEVGLCIADDGESYKVCWSLPETGSEFSVDDWDFAGTVLVDGKTTYECRVPWNKSGVMQVGNGVEIGLTYAIGDQEDFNVEANMVEWPDALLGTKNADCAAVAKLVGAPDDDIEDISQDVVIKPDIDYVVPENADTGVPTIINSNMTTGACSIITTLSENWFSTYGTLYSGNVLLAPTDDPEVYTVVETAQGDGTSVSFASEIGEGYIVLALHGDNSEGADPASCELRDRYLGLDAGTEITFKGIDFENGKITAGNPMFWYVKSDEEPSQDPSTEPSQDEPSQDEESSTEPESSDTSSEEAESKEESSKPEESSKTEDKTEQGGMPVWLIIVIAVVAVAVIAVVVIVIVKKKK